MAFTVRFDLAGEGVPEDAFFVVRAHEAWAPKGVERFKELVDSGFYDDTRFFRVLDGNYDIFIAQFGINGTPEVHSKWDRQMIQDDPQTYAKRNVRGTLAFATSGPNTRTTQLFLNFGDSSKVLDNDFVVFAEVVENMDIIDLIYKVGEGAPSGGGPNQGDIVAKGNDYLDSEFPKLTKITKATIIDSPAKDEL